MRFSATLDTVNQILLIPVGKGKSFFDKSFMAALESQAENVKTGWQNCRV